MGFLKVKFISTVFLLFLINIAYSFETYLVYIERTPECIDKAEVYGPYNTSVSENQIEDILNMGTYFCFRNYEKNIEKCYFTGIPLIPYISLYINESNETILGKINNINWVVGYSYNIYIDFVPDTVSYVEGNKTICMANVEKCIVDRVCNKKCGLDLDCVKMEEENKTAQTLIQINETVLIEKQTEKNRFFVILAIVSLIIAINLIWILLRR